MAKNDKDVTPYKLILKNVRLSFAHLRKPYEEGGKLSARFLIDKEAQADQIEKVKKVIDRCMRKELDVKKLPAERKCLRDGDDIDKEGYEGHMFVSGANDKIQIRSKANQPIPSDEADDHSHEPYSGCYVNVSLNLWAQDNKDYGKRINASINGVQFSNHGEAFGRGQVDTEDDFDDIDEGDDDDMSWED